MQNAKLSAVQTKNSRNKVRIIRYGVIKNESCNIKRVSKKGGELTVCEVHVPEIQDHEVLVKIKTATDGAFFENSMILSYELSSDGLSATVKVDLSVFGGWG